MSLARVLIVDQEDQIRKLLRVLLVRAGYEVHAAKTPKKAMALCLSAGPFDLVLSDVLMPEMDGHELARWVAGQSPKSRVILMSEYDYTCNSCPYASRCRLIVKPFHPKQVLATIALALGPPS